jgi:predicted esterase
LAALLFGGAVREAAAQKLLLGDGRTLAGKVAATSSVAENPDSPAGQAGEIAVRPILVVDDGLRRVFVPKLRVAEVLEDVPEQLVKIELWQNAARGGGAVASVGPSLGVTPFDKYGRRIYEMQTGDGPLAVIQGITELTPRYARVEGLHGTDRPIVWDMRLSTSSIPLESLADILHQWASPDDWQARLQIVRFYSQAERFHEARRELEAVIADFPEAEDLSAEVRRLRQMGARRVLEELKLRRAAGQHRLVQRLLENFPGDDVAGETLQQVREMLVEFQQDQARMQAAGANLQRMVDGIDDPDQRGLAAPLVAEVLRDLSLNNVDRLAGFVQLLDDESQTAEQKAALALTGWLLGPEEATQDLSLAISLIRIRDVVVRYLREASPQEREALLESIRSMDGASAATLAKLIARMRPPWHDDDLLKQPGGQLELLAPGETTDGDFRYWVQLPPEYDPYRRYPTLVVLNGAYNAPLDELNFWAGGPPTAAADGKPGWRNGQAMRHGYVVLTVEWQKPQQFEYEYSSREHTAVLTCLRDAMRRLSIDSDRIYVTGHGIGGELALDLALSHPDLWAGAIPFVVRIEKYAKFYWENAAQLPLYFVCGELDGKRMSENAPVLDRLLKKPGFDATVAEYLGRGHEPYHDEILALFDWMGRKRRGPPPAEFSCNVLRPWDNYFWYVECGEFPRDLMTYPAEWDAARPRPTLVDGKLQSKNRLLVRSAAESLTLWLSPDLVDFAEPIRITVGRRKLPDPPGGLQPDAGVLLEDVRTRADRQRPFWARVDWP